MKVKKTEIPNLHIKLEICLIMTAHVSFEGFQVLCKHIIWNHSFHSYILPQNFEFYKQCEHNTNVRFSGVTQR